MNLTKHEKAVLKAMAFNHYGEGTNTWAWAINESRTPCGIKGKALSGVISSLVKKGLFKVEGEGREGSIWTTKAGMEAMKELGWMTAEGSPAWDKAK